MLQVLGTEESLTAYNAHVSRCSSGLLLVSLDHRFVRMKWSGSQLNCCVFVEQHGAVGVFLEKMRGRFGRSRDWKAMCASS